MSQLLTPTEVDLVDVIIHRKPLSPWLAVKKTRMSVASEIYDYMLERAQREAAQMNLTLTDFDGCMTVGCAGFFGVSYSSCGIFADSQEPKGGFLADFLHRRGASLIDRQRTVIGNVLMAVLSHLFFSKHTEPTHHLQVMPSPGGHRHSYHC